MPRKLLTTWENWSARQTLTGALDRATTEDARAKLRDAIAATPEVDPLDALRDVTALVALLNAWQWQAVYAARRADATWSQIATGTSTTVEQVRADFAEAIDHQERIGLDVTAHREVL